MELLPHLPAKAKRSRFLPHPVDGLRALAASVGAGGNGKCEGDGRMWGPSSSCTVKLVSRTRLSPPDPLHSSLGGGELLAG